MFAILLALAAAAPPGQSYRIDATLRPEDRTIRADETIVLRSPAEGPIRAIPLHLYLNGFRHEDTTYFREAEADVDALIDDHGSPWGQIEILRATAGGRSLAFAPIAPDDHNPGDASLVEAALDPPLLPGQTLELKLELLITLPVPIDRTGGARDFFLVAQWYPKLPVFDPRGQRFILHQFHGDTEFFGEVADYEVNITAPPAFVVGGTGTQTSSVPGHHRFVAHEVIDFAWVAGSNLMEETHPVPRRQGPPLEVRYLAPIGRALEVGRSREGVERSFPIFERRVGSYPYPALTVVLPPAQAAATEGMEYPMLITNVTGDPVWSLPFLRDLRLLEDVVIHELGHQWFYALLATNEQEEAFLDEGFNTYWEVEILEELYGKAAGMGAPIGHPIDTSYFRTTGLARAADEIREPIRKNPSSDYYRGHYGAQVYDRPAGLLATARALFGTEVMDQVFSVYFSRWKLRHPHLEDFLAIAAEVGGPKLHALLEEGFSRPEVPRFVAERLGATPWSAPRGLVQTATPAACAGSPGTPLSIAIHDPGWARGSSASPGRTEIAEGPARGQADEAECQVSEAEISGPGWDHLPIEVELRFSDGRVWRETWDGRAAWRRYRVVDTAAITAIVLDPEGRLPIDPFPEAHQRLLERSGRLVGRVSLWLSALSLVLTAWLGVL